jgi:hypothetical protein
MPYTHVWITTEFARLFTENSLQEKSQKIKIQNILYTLNVKKMAFLIGFTKIN